MGDDGIHCGWRPRGPGCGRQGLCKQGLCSQLAQRLALPLFGWLNLDKSPSVTKAQFLIFKMGVIMVSTGSTL